MEISRRGFVQGGLAVAAGAALMPFSQARAALSDEVLAAAKKEGKVTYYSSTNPALSKLLADAFNVHHPEVSVEIVRLATGPLSKRYSAEMEAGAVVADILQMGDPLILEDGYKSGWFANLTDLEFHKNWPDAYKTEYSATVSIFPDTVTYNTDKVKGDDIPRSWEDLLKPQWADQILMVDPRNAPQTTALLLILQETFGEDFLDRLKAQRPRFISSTVPGSQMLAAGEASLLIPNLRMVSYSLIEQGAPLDDVTPTPVTGWGSLLSITKDAPNPNAARLLTSFILSREGQEVLSKDVAASPLGDVEGALPLAADLQVGDVRNAIRQAPAVAARLGLT